MMIGLGRFAAVVIAGGIAVAALAQGGASQTSKFLKAVREEDGNTATSMLSAPGSVVIDSREVVTNITALEVIIERQDNVWLSFLAGKGANLNLPNSKGAPPLLQAVESNFAEGVATLLRRGANVNADNRGGETPLIRAVQRRNLALVRLLMAGGADPDRRDVLVGRSARDYARADTRMPTLLRAIEETTPAPKRAVSGPKL